MRKKILKLQKYSPFFILLSSILAFSAVLKFQGFTFVQFVILTILSVLYLSFALTHHFFDKSLSFEIMLEYVLTVLLALIILYGLLL